MRRVAVLTLLVAVTLAGCTSGESPASDTAPGQMGGAAGSPSEATTAQACRTDFSPSVLPSWANGGFDPPTQPMPYVLGDQGDIAAILWADHEPLVVPPAVDRTNKILWVSRDPSSGGMPLRIQATLTGSGQAATRTVDGGPGPSIIDLPAPGCWSFELTWGDHHDHLQLAYSSR
jgi:hypothetical protein